MSGIGRWILKILVTGGAGFIGSHIVDSLISQGNAVSIIDDLYTGYERNINARANFYRLDIGSSDVSRVFEIEKPAVVFHEAAQIVVTRSISEPDYDARINILGSLNVLINCVKYGVNKIIYASSCALYGKPDYLPVDENHPVNALSPYGVSKHTVEHYLRLYHELYGLNYIALRYANVYGPRQNPKGEGGVVAIFSGKMLHQEQPTIFGSGNKYRDYVYVADVVKANLCAMSSDNTGIYNVGTGKETSDQAVFDTISKECSFRGSPLYVAERPGEIKRMYLDSTRASRDLGWSPEVDFPEGISRTLSYYRSELSLLKV
jgi:UDP-glucose 4-epimerase